MLLDLGAHLVDQALSLHGPVADVYAEVDARRGGADDDVFIALRHTGGVTSHLAANALAAAPGPRLRVLGSRAAYVVQAVDGQEDALRAGHLPDEPSFGVEPRQRWGHLAAGEDLVEVEPERGRWLEFYTRLERAVRGDGPTRGCRGRAGRARGPRRGARERRGRRRYAPARARAGLTLVTRTAVKVVTAVRRGELSATAATEEALGLIERLDGRIGAFQVVRARRALEEARQVDERPDRAGLALAGLPSPSRTTSRSPGSRCAMGLPPAMPRRSRPTTRSCAACAAPAPWWWG